MAIEEYFENHGPFKDELRGKYKRFCLFNDEFLRLIAAMWIRENLRCPQGGCQ